MQTTSRLGASPAADAGLSTAIFTGDGTTTMSHEIDFRMQRLEAEAAHERLASATREGLRQHLGHALMALGRAIHGIEPERAKRPALDAR